MREYLEYTLVKFVLFLTKLIPTKMVYFLFKKISYILFKIDKRRRLLTIKNLEYAFPKMQYHELYSIAQKAYEGVAITIAETLLMYHDSLCIDNMIVNKEEILETFHCYFNDTSTGKILITGHFSNWELLAQFLGKSGYPIKNIARIGNNKLIDEHIVQSFRGKFGNKNIPKKNAIISLVKTLKQGLRVSILFDQKPSRNNSIETLFFGHPVRTVDVIAQLKLKYNPLILPTFIIRLPDGKYKVVLQEPIEYTAEEESDFTVKIAKMTQRYNDTIEAIIREHPEQWFWMHDRWRIAK